MPQCPKMQNEPKGAAMGEKCKTKPNAPRFPSPGTLGEGEGEGQSEICNLKYAKRTHQDPHPNPFPDYREREMRGICKTKPTAS